MNDLKEKNERAVGESFIEWLNSEKGTKYRFIKRPDRAADRGYRGQVLGLVRVASSPHYGDVCRIKRSF